MEASGNVIQVGIDDAIRHLRGVLHAQEASVISAFEASIGIGESAALGLEEWAEAFARCDGVEPCKEALLLARTMTSFAMVRNLRTVLP